MNLQHLCSAQCADVYYDTVNNWAFVDWVGELTLESVQHTCLGIARCFLDVCYPRVLNSNAQVTSVTWDVPQWLATEFLPALTLSGVEQMAWVVPPSLRARNKVLDTVGLFPHVAISLFEDVELAVAWLQQTAPTVILPSVLAPSRPYADELKLTHIVTNFAQQLEPATLEGK